MIQQMEGTILALSSSQASWGVGTLYLTCLDIEYNVCLKLEPISNFDKGGKILKWSLPVTSKEILAAGHPLSE